MKHAITSLLLLLLAVEAAPRPLPGYTFSAITVDDGLPHNFVDDIFKDSRGYIWISTGGGLARHDGHDLVILDANSSPVALKSNTIHKVREDACRRLWIISTGGVDLVDPRANRAIPLPVEVIPIDLLVDKKGDAWILATNNLYKISLAANGDILRVDTTGRPANGSFSSIQEIDGVVHVALDGKIFTAAPSLRGGLALQRAFRDVDFGANVHVSSILRKENAFWIGTENGLARYNLNDASLDMFTHDEDDPASISQNMITGLLLLDDGTLVASTLRGLNFFDAANASFQRVSSRDGRVGQTLNNDFVNCIVAYENTIWVGTEAGGANKMTAPRLLARAYLHDASDPASLSANPVNAILEDRAGNLWVGTVEGGLNRKRPGENSFARYTADKGYIPHNSVSALAEDDKGNLWVGTWGSGTAVFQGDGKNGEARISLPTEYTSILQHDSINRAIWIGTSRGVYLRDLVTGQLSEPLPDSLARDIRGTLGALVDREDRLWIGTTAGLLAIDLRDLDENKKARGARRFRTGDALLDRLFFTRVTCIHEDHLGNLWIGSNNHGLCKVSPRATTPPLHYTTADGLPNNTIFGILEDARGLLWISTAHGISVRDPGTGLFTNYTRDDGLPGNQFYLNAYCRSADGNRLYFGGVEGVVAIDGVRESPPVTGLPVAITRFQVLDKRIALEDPYYFNPGDSRVASVDLHESDKSFSIEFSALDHAHPSTVAYAYRLSGFDNTWINVNADRRFATYTNLPAGAYTFQVKRRDSDVITTLRVIVHPFFYKTAWFISLLAVAIGLALFLAHRWRVANLRRRGKILQEKIALRTRALEQQKQLLELQAVELQTQNTVLKTQHEQLLHMAREVKQSTDDRVNFFTNISHEFRTPITLVTGPLERALRISYNPAVIEQLQLARRNAAHLLSLVNQLMDFRKIEEGRATVHLENKNFLLFLDELLPPFDVFLEERRATLRDVYHIPAPTFLFDQENLRKLLSNLLANAIKFTPDGGTVTLYARSMFARDGNEYLYICVSDNGPGIKQQELQRVFDRFFQSREEAPRAIRGQSGTGIGLYLCKSIVELLGGAIVARNNPSRGAAIRVLLPLARDPSGHDLARSLPRTAPAAQGPTTAAILVVEDNADARLFVTSILRDHYRVEQAEDGEQALRVLHSRRVDLVISDLVMPVMDGLELSRRVKGSFATSHIPFIMLTARVDPDSRLSSYNTGVDDYIEKPFTDELLLARVQNILQRRDADRRRLSLNMNTAELDLPAGSNDERFLRRVVDALKANYKNDAFDVGDFALAMKTSKSLLNKKLQALAGRPAGQFIRDYRLNVAREIIRESNGNLTISEIAYSVGFNDPKYFTRCFTRHFGVTPTTARDATKGQQHDPGV
ncbi:MAG: response regulator [Odoribacteraceae bacterium]|jgi:signal transduction histidine kinase/ligand-binding sensor domain-containing protein/DNA-binding response OmpR family regulator|nr:response regulator [Odoribacteraceae bacterium]